MANWFFVFGSTPVSVVAYYAPTVGVRILNQIGLTLLTIMPVTGAAGASMVPDGQRLYAAFFDATGRVGTASGQIYGWNIGTDPLFAAPISNTPTISETGTGLITAGLHNIGYLMQTRNGYTGQPCPVGAGGFTPVPFTSTGNHNLRVSIPGPFPSYVTGLGTLQVVMTTAANPNRYYAVPGAVAFAIGSPVNITISITDDDLAATGQDVTSYMNVLQSSLGGTPPFLPSAIFTYSSRMAYVTIDQDGFPVVYFSDPSNYQFVTADQHAIYLEGRQQVVQGCSLRGVCYLGLTSGFYATEDNGDVPVTWTPPQRVDGSIGILAPNCLYANPSLGYALVAGQRGFYLFQGGIFPPLPLSYYQNGDWSRINWTIATQVQIADDELNKRFIVAAPLTNTVASVTGSGPYTITTNVSPHLYQTGIACKIAGVSGTPTITVTGPGTFTIPGGSGAPTVGGLIAPQTMTHQMTWDYTEGDNAETVKYSIQSFTSYRAAAMAIIRNETTLLNEVWYAPAASAALIRQNDGTEAHPYRDIDMSGNPAAINAQYQTALVPEPLEMGMTNHFFHGSHLAVRGNGSLSISAQDTNNQTVQVPLASPVPLQSAPENELLVQWFLAAQRQSITFSNSNLDEYWVLSLIRVYYSDSYPLN